ERLTNIVVNLRLARRSSSRARKRQGERSPGASGRRNLDLKSEQLHRLGRSNNRTPPNAPAQSATDPFSIRRRSFAFNGEANGAEPRDQRPAGSRARGLHGHGESQALRTRLYSPRA